MQKHITLITGATSGIGLSCSKLFCENGHTVFGVSRSGTCSSYTHPNFHTLKMDVTDDKSIEKVLKDIVEQEYIIDIVVHCAGYGIAGSVEDTPIERVKEQFETNYFGVLRVNSAVLPILRENPVSHIIILGSIAGRIGIPFQSHYSASKFALESYLEALRMECRPYGVKATIVEAGDTATAFTANRTYYALPNSIYTTRGKKAVAKMEHDEKNGYSPDVVASVVYKMSQKKNPPPRVAVGFGYKTLMVLKRFLPDKVTEKVLSILYLSGK